MAFVYADRVKETSTTTGTGTLNLAGAATGFRTFVAGIGTTNTCPYVIEDANGTAWEVGIGTVTDATPDTLARTTLLSSSTGSAINLSAGTHTVFCDWPSARAQQSPLEHVAGTDADTTMAVGQMYVVDMSAWATADRNYTLPAVAAVGDRIGVMVTAGDASHELILKANTGDTLNGVSAAEWSRLFITGEVVIMRCVTANGAWIVEVDGRIQQRCIMRLSTDTSVNETAGVWTSPTAKSGAWFADVDNASLSSVANDRFKVRRSATYVLAAVAHSIADITDQTSWGVVLWLNGTATVIVANIVRQSGAAPMYAQVSVPVGLAVDDTVNFQFQSSAGSVKCNADTSMRTWFSGLELL